MVWARLAPETPNCVRGRPPLPASPPTSGPNFGGEVTRTERPARFERSDANTTCGNALEFSPFSRAAGERGRGRGGSVGRQFDAFRSAPHSPHTTPPPGLGEGSPAVARNERKARRGRGP